MSNDQNLRYSDEDLQEFKVLVEAKLNQSTEELATTERQISDLNENGFNQQGGDWYDDSTAHTDLEMLQRMLSRQQRHVQDLRNALLRISNKTYGICTVTGNLIGKERLRLVPHATKSVDGKNMANSNIRPEINTSRSNGDDFFAGNEDSVPGKTIGDKVRISNGKQPIRGGTEDWEMGTESMEDSDYQKQKFEEEEE